MNDNFTETAKDMLQFVSHNPTAYHTVASIRERLDAQGFKELTEGTSWHLEPDGGYYVIRNGSSIIAFRLGAETDGGFQIAASHTDSPMFRIKERAQVYTGKQYTRLNTEGYGGMICSTWMDRPLSVAGRLILKEEGDRLTTRLIDIDRDLLMIPSVAIHMNRAINDGYKFNKQVDMLPLFAQGDDPEAFLKLLCQEAGVSPENILGSDLFLYSRQQPSLWGKEEEFISSGRLDDQQCAYASLKALLEADVNHSVAVMACFDNEEVGSGTKQGANSTFLTDTLQRISSALGRSPEEHRMALASGFMLSADNAHAVHPNHPEYSDEGNRAYMNEGVVVKTHAGQKYTTDAMSMAMVRLLAERAKVPLQYFANRSDQLGGSTLGNISAAHVSVNCADVGLAQLAMHSAYETAGVKDTAYMIALMKKLYSANPRELGSGIYQM